MCPSLCLPACLPVCLSVCLPVCLSVYPLPVLCMYAWLYGCKLMCMLIVIDNTSMCVVVSDIMLIHWVIVMCNDQQTPHCCVWQMWKKKEAIWTKCRNKRQKVNWQNSKWARDTAERQIWFCCNWPMYTEPLSRPLHPHASWSGDKRHIQPTESYPLLTAVLHQNQGYCPSKTTYIFCKGLFT